MLIFLVDHLWDTEIDSLEVPHKQSSKNTTTTKRCTVRLGNIQFSGQERFCSFRCRKEQRNCSVFPLQKGGSGIVLLFPLQKGGSEKVLFYPLKEGGSGKVMFFLLQKGDSGKVLFYPIRCRKEAAESHVESIWKVLRVLRSCHTDQIWAPTHSPADKNKKTSGIYNLFQYCIRLKQPKYWYFCSA